MPDERSDVRLTEGEWLPEWLPNVIRSISRHAAKPLPYKALLARPEELESPTF